MTAVVSPRVKELPIPKPLLTRVAVDFDGVLHGYSNGWQGGAIYDPPVEGTREALIELTKRYELVVFTARHDLDAVRAWLVKHRLSHFFHDVSNRKPAAAVYLDDRALKFTSWAQALEDLSAPRP